MMEEQLAIVFMRCADFVVLFFLADLLYTIVEQVLTVLWRSYRVIAS
jgi:hypothetical protein